MSHYTDTNHQEGSKWPHGHRHWHHRRHHHFKLHHSTHWTENHKKRSQATLDAPLKLHPEAGHLLYNYTADYLAQKTRAPYVFGGDNPNGGIDCSHWVAHSTLTAMQEINNAIKGHVYNMGEMAALMQTSAAYQIENIARKVGFLSQKQLQDGNVPAGTLIGIQHQHVPEFAQGRPNNISHIVQVVHDKNGNPMVSESGHHANVNGVALTPYKEWLARSQANGDRLYATNPFALAKPHNSLAENRPRSRDMGAHV